MASPSHPAPPSPLRLLALILIFAYLFFSLALASMLGDVRESEGSQNSAELEELARFAVEEHNKKEVPLCSSICLKRAHLNH